MGGIYFSPTLNRLGKTSKLRKTVVKSSKWYNINRTCTKRKA